MWLNIAYFILRNRLLLIILLALTTLYMGYRSQDVELSYQFLNILPTNDPDLKTYNEFKQKFGEDAATIFVGINDKKLYEVNNFNLWFDLGLDLKKIDGVVDVLSITNLYDIKKNTEKKKFDVIPVLNKKPETQQELEENLKKIYELPFYEGLIYNKDNDATLMAVKISNEKINSKERNNIVKNIVAFCKDFETKSGVKVHYSGLPLIRTNNTTKIAKELGQFIFLAIGVTALILYLLFRSFYAVIFPLIVVGSGVLWSVGSLALFGYDMTILTGLIPPLIIVIGVPNCIFFLNKYHDEYRTHQNQSKALTRMVQRIGIVTFLTNFTTAIGLGVFAFTSSPVLREFGIVSSINVMSTYIISIIFIPIIFSYLPPPSFRSTKHLENKVIISTLELAIKWVNNYRTRIYIVTFILVVLGIIGFFKIKKGGFFTEDIPKSDPINKDLSFFEKNFKGVMPFEIIIDTKKKGNATKLTTLQQVEELNKILLEYPELARPISLNDFSKFSRQAFYNGKQEKYDLPSSNEQKFILPYVANSKINDNMEFAMVDKSRQLCRISVRVADVGAVRIDQIKDELSKKISTIFNPEKFNVLLTGTTIIFAKSNEYLNTNLKQSVFQAIVLISLTMATLFSSYKMIIISLIPNLVPLLITAGIMGFFGIPLKPSTVLIFSVAFGITVDTTIHFLSKYRQELKFQKQLNISDAVNNSLKEAGISMLYTSIILICGFAIFIFSDFGGTVALGLLVSITFFFATFANLLLLPAMLLSLERRIYKIALKEPLIEVYDEDEDIELDQLELEQNHTEEKVKTT